MQQAVRATKCLSPKLRKRLFNFEITTAYLRHITGPLAAEVSAELDQQLKEENIKKLEGAFVLYNKEGLSTSEVEEKLREVKTGKRTIMEEAIAYFMSEGGPAKEVEEEKPTIKTAEDGDVTEKKKQIKEI